MRYPVVVLPLARTDILHASNWYESQQEGLGKRFRQEIAKAIDSLYDPVKGYGPVYMSLSRIFVQQFPFVIYFKNDSSRNCMVVYAVLHRKQDRGSVLKQRL